MVDTDTFRLESQQSQSSEQGTRIQRTYKIACDAADDTSETVRAWEECPRYGQYLPIFSSGSSGIDYDEDWICLDSTISSLGGAEGEFWFFINATYSPKPTGWDGSILSKVDKRGGGATTTEPRMFDAAGNALCNSAGELFDPLPEEPISEQQYVLVVRRTTLDDFKWMSWKTNSDVWHGHAVGTCMTGEIGWQRSDAGDTPHWEITIPIFYRAAGWALKLVDAGFNYLEGGASSSGGGILRRIVGPDGFEPTNPVPLDGSGNVLEPGEPLVIGTFVMKGTAVFGTGGMALPDPLSL